MYVNQRITKNVAIAYFQDFATSNWVEDEFFNILFEYVRNIKIGERPNKFTFPNAFNTLGQHKYFGLFTQVLCV